MPIRLSENPVSGIGQKHCAIEDLVWLGQFVFAAQKVDATDEAEFLEIWIRLEGMDTLFRDSLI